MKTKIKCESEGKYISYINKLLNLGVGYMTNI